MLHSATTENNDWLRISQIVIVGLIQLTFLSEQYPEDKNGQFLSA